MCLIILAPKGTDKYSEFIIEGIVKASLSNTDGIGFAYKRNSKKDQIFIDKGFTNVDQFLKTYRAHKLGKNDEVMIHLRIGNKGAKTADMNHPFVISKDPEVIVSRNTNVNLPVLVHNGTFHSFSKANDDKSDTYYFVEEMMSYSYMQDFLLQDFEGFTKLFKNTLSTNKLGFLFPGDVEMFHIGEFIEDEGYYFSNVSYKEDRYRNVGGAEYYNGYVNTNKTVNLATSGRDFLTPAGTRSIVRRNTGRSIWEYNEFLWIPYSFTNSQALESVFIPLEFNYKHFQFIAQATIPKLGLENYKTYEIEIYDDDRKHKNHCHVLTLKWGDAENWQEKAYLSNDELIEHCSIRLNRDWDSKYAELFKLMFIFRNATIDEQFYNDIKEVLDKTINSPQNVCDFKTESCLWRDTLKLWYNYLTVIYFPENKKELYKLQEEDTNSSRITNLVKHTRGNDEEPPAYMD